MKVAVVGVTGLVGTRMVEVLEERNFPVDEFIPVASGRSAGKLISTVEAQRLVDALLQGENPEFTPSGKRIISLVPADEIENRF